MIEKFSISNDSGHHDFVIKSIVNSMISNHGNHEGNRGHGGTVVTLSPPTSEAGVRSPSRPYVGKLVVACRWSAVYSTEP